MSRKTLQEFTLVIWIISSGMRARVIRLAVFRLRLQVLKPALSRFVKYAFDHSINPLIYFYCAKGRKIFIDLTLQACEITCIMAV